MRRKFTSGVKRYFNDLKRRSKPLQLGWRGVLVFLALVVASVLVFGYFGILDAGAKIMVAVLVLLYVAGLNFNSRGYRWFQVAFGVVVALHVVFIFMVPFDLDRFTGRAVGGLGALDTLSMDLSLQFLRRRAGLETPGLYKLRRERSR